MSTVRLQQGALLALAFLGLGSPFLGGQEKKAYPTIGTVERLDPRFDRLVPPGAKIEKLAEGFDWTEGPVWVKSGGYLLFSNIPQNAVMKWQEGKGASVFLKPSGYTGKDTNLREPGSNGLLLDAEGRLILMEHGDRRVTRLDLKDRKKTVLAEKYMGKLLNSPNDGVSKS